jgi:hypothetical protein
MSNCLVTDVIGYITKYTALSTFVPKNKEKVTILRELYLKDLRFVSCLVAVNSMAP